MLNADMFLKVTTTKQGLIKGEAHDDKHGEEIEVVKWAWGAQAHTNLSSLGPTGKASLGELEITKRADCASTALMAALVHNEDIKEAVLTVRKAGKFPLEYITIKLESARVTGLHLESHDEAVVEKLTLAYQRIAVTYKPQKSDGSGGPEKVFTAEITANV
jgi:type VI secretion system secreted protein Hcp